MQRNGIKKVETDIAKLSFRESKTVEIDNIALLPERFVVTKTSRTPDKKAIKEALENGEEVSGARIEEHQNLQIK
ncbi:MAG: siphovirus Gp157 family protein [Candidatus Moraniibacteriota bacterium]